MKSNPTLVGERRRMPGFRCPGRLGRFSEHRESLDEWLGKPAGNLQRESGPADRAWMMIRAHSWRGDLRYVVRGVRHGVPLDTGQAAGLLRRVGFGIVGRRLVRRWAWSVRIHGRGVVTAAGLMGLALSLWSTANASASPRFAARAAGRSHVARSRGRAQSRSVGRRLDAGRAVPDWLATINRYRAAAGLAAVSDQPAWDVGLERHLTYMANTPSQYFTGQYQSAHTENPDSPFYSNDGASEAGYSDLIQGAAFSPLQAVNEWLSAPFHAIGVLRAQLRQIALAEAPSTGDAGLDVIQGLDYNRPAATAPILFPGPGVTTDLLTFGGERPDPLETCGWQQDGPVGLPLIIMLPRDPARALSASVTGPTGTESNANGRLCVRRQAHVSLVRSGLRAERPLHPEHGPCGNPHTSGPPHRRQLLRQNPPAPDSGHPLDLFGLRATQHRTITVPRAKAATTRISGIAVHEHTIRVRSLPCDGLWPVPARALVARTSFHARSSIRLYRPCRRARGTIAQDRPWPPGRPFVAVLGRSHAWWS